MLKFSIFIGLSLGLSMMSFFSSYLVKVSLQSMKFSELSLEKIFPLLVGLMSQLSFWIASLGYFGCLICFVLLLNMFELSRVFPVVFGLNVVATVIGSAMFLNEHVSFAHLAGIVVILSGAMLTYYAN